MTLGYIVLATFAGGVLSVLIAAALTVHVSTKLNRSHVVHGEQALILPALGRGSSLHRAAQVVRACAMIPYSRCAMVCVCIGGVGPTCLRSSKVRSVASRGGSAHRRTRLDERKPLRASVSTTVQRSGFVG